jgi:uncharacterized protein (TIGR02145 family)
MVGDLEVSKFRNGDPIYEAKSADEWYEAGINGRPVWCYYDNDIKNGEKYGKLYNWYAVNDTRGLAPNGWHIPSQKEWEILSNSLGGDKIAGNKMKDVRNWTDKEVNVTNENNFSLGVCDSCCKILSSSTYFFGNFHDSGKLTSKLR